MTSRIRPSLSTSAMVLLIVSATALVSTHCHAHAIVLKTSLTEHPIKKDAADSITLHFNSRIEVKLSRAMLVSRDQPERALELVAGKAPGDVLVQLPALAPGNYALRYRVLAADGYVTEDTIRFPGDGSAGFDHGGGTLARAALCGCAAATGVENSRDHCRSGDAADRRDSGVLPGAAIAWKRVEVVYR